MSTLKSEEVIVDEKNFKKFSNYVIKTTSISDEELVRNAYNNISSCYQEILNKYWGLTGNFPCENYEDMEERFKIKNSEKKVMRAVWELESKSYDDDTILMIDERTYPAHIARGLCNLWKDTYKNKGCIVKFSGKRFMKEISSLEHNKMRALNLKYGLLDGKKRTFEEIGKELFIEKARAAKIVEDALRALRKYYHWCRACDYEQYCQKYIDSFVNDIKSRVNLSDDEIISVFEELKSKEEYFKIIPIINLYFSMKEFYVYHEFEKINDILKISNSEEIYIKMIQEIIELCYSEDTRLLEDRYKFTSKTAKCICDLIKDIIDKNENIVSFKGDILLNDMFTKYLTEDEKDTIKLAFGFKDSISVYNKKVSYTYDVNTLDSAISKLKKHITDCAKLENTKISPRVNESDGIEVLNLSVRTYNALKRNGITNINEIFDTPLSKVKAFRNLGETSFAELMQKLTDFVNRKK